MDNWFDIDEFDPLYANIQPKYKIWYNLCISEIVCLIFHIIFEIWLIPFLFIQKCKYLQIIIEKEKKIRKNHKNNDFNEFHFFCSDFNYYFFINVFFHLYNYDTIKYF